MYRKKLDEEIISVKYVAERLVKGEVTDLEKFLKALFVILFGFVGALMWLIAFSSAFWKTNISTVGFSHARVYFFVTLFWLVPTIALFINDQRNGGKHFWERYFCLVSPLVLQLFAIRAALALAALIGTEVLHIQRSNIDSLLLQLMLVVGILFFFYWRLNKWLAYTAQHKQS